MPGEGSPSPRASLRRIDPLPLVAVSPDGGLSGSSNGVTVSPRGSPRVSPRSSRVLRTTLQHVSSGAPEDSAAHSASPSDLNPSGLEAASAVSRAFFEAGAGASSGPVAQSRGPKGGGAGADVSTEVQRELQKYASENCVQSFGVVFVLEVDTARRGTTIVQVSENIAKYGYEPSFLLGRDLRHFLANDVDGESLLRSIAESKPIDSPGHSANRAEAKDMMRALTGSSGYSRSQSPDENGVSGDNPQIAVHTGRIQATWRRASLHMVCGIASGDSMKGAAAAEAESGGRRLPKIASSQNLPSVAVGGAAARIVAFSATVATSNLPNVFILTLEHTEYAEDKRPAIGKVLVPAVQRLMRATSVDRLLQELVETCREQAGASRCMVYRFAEDFHGEVVAESRAAGVHDSFMGMHFPAVDIPVFARLLFMRTPFRMIVDVGSAMVNMVPSARAKEPTPPQALLAKGKPAQKTESGAGAYASVTVGGVGTSPLKVDMSECVARWANGCHLQYLANMKVRGSLTVPLMIKKKLWGLLVIHHMSQPLYLPMEARYMMSLLAMTATILLDKFNTESELRRAVQMSRLLPFELNAVAPGDYFSVVAPGILDLVKAKSVVVYAGESMGVGIPPSSCDVYGSPVSKENVRTILEMVSVQQNKNVFVTNSLKEWVGPAESLLRQGDDYLLAGIVILYSDHFWVAFLREELVQTIKWAGRDDQPTSDGDLTPRWSFQQLGREKRGQSVAWSEQDINFLCKMRDELVANEGRRKAEEERRQAMLNTITARDVALRMAKQKGSFLAHMSHELRTPFNGMIGMLQLVLDSQLTEQQRDGVSTAYECATGMLSILDDVLLVSKLESSKVALHMLEFDLVSLIYKAHNLMLVRANQLEVNVSFMARSAKSSNRGTRVVMQSLLALQCRGDPGRIRQVLLNLVGNAIKFTGEDGTVSINLTTTMQPAVILSLVEEKAKGYSASSIPSVEFKRVVSSMRGGGEPFAFDITAPGSENTAESEAGTDDIYIILSVDDTGSGMDAQQLMLLVTPFTQLDEGPSRRYEGTGLGLVICKELVRLMGGEIITFSTKGRGSSFVVLLRLGAATGVATANSRSADAEDFCTDTLAALGRGPSRGHSGAVPEATETAAAARNVRLSKATDPLAPAKELLQTIQDVGSWSSSRGSEKGFNGTGEPQAEATSTSPALELTNSPIVLVVDDNNTNQKVLVNMVQRCQKALGGDMRVLVAKDGRQALETAQEHHDDIFCIFMDLHMPVMNGYESSEALRQWETEWGRRQAYIIALTADVVESSQDRCLASGINRCLSKPIDLKHLENLLRELLHEVQLPHQQGKSNVSNQMGA